jgi:hypothetical protein
VEPSDLQAATNQNRIDLLRADLDLCFTFADLAKTEFAMHHRTTAKRILAKAEKGFAAISRMLPDVGDGREKNAIGKKLAELHTRLDSEQQRLNSENAAA